MEVKNQKPDKFSANADTGWCVKCHCYKCNEESTITGSDITKEVVKITDSATKKKPEGMDVVTLMYFECKNPKCKRKFFVQADNEETATLLTEYKNKFVRAISIRKRCKNPKGKDATTLNGLNRAANKIKTELKMKRHDLIGDLTDCVAVVDGKSIVLNFTDVE